jgi:hypothetical protein
VCGKAASSRRSPENGKDLTLNKRAWGTRKFKNGTEKAKAAEYRNGGDTLRYKESQTDKSQIRKRQQQVPHPSAKSAAGFGMTS